LIDDRRQCTTSGTAANSRLRICLPFAAAAGSERIGNVREVPPAILLRVRTAVCPEESGG
jgi:hypothetical protein